MLPTLRYAHSALHPIHKLRITNYESRVINHDSRFTNYKSRITMPRFIKNRTKTKGQVPGSLIFLGNQKVEQIKLNLISYDNNVLNEKEIQDIEEIRPLDFNTAVNWLNTDGIHDAKSIEYIGNQFNIHALHLEDLLNTDQRPSFSEGDDYLFLIIKMLTWEKDSEKILDEQVSFILTKNCLLTFQEQKGDVFEAVRDRIRKSKGRIRSGKADYLLYALLDTIVDNYLILLGNIGEKIEDLEDKILKHPTDKVADKIYKYKIELNYLRKHIRPVRDMVTLILKSENELLSKKTKQFFRDLNDLVLQCVETIESYQNILNDQLSIYNTNVNNKLNEVMKILTIFAAIFIPLTFIAGIYGTNFEFIPELKLRFGYLYFWIVILATGLITILYFKRKKWL